MNLYIQYLSGKAAAAAVECGVGGLLQWASASGGGSASRTTAVVGWVCMTICRYYHYLLLGTPCCCIYPYSVLPEMTYFKSK